MEISVITRVEQVVQIALCLTRSWFRGQDRTYGQLLPRVWRDEYSEGYRQLRPDFEFSMAESFMRRAPAILNSVPRRDDYESWLFLMQHYGTPTRLLDWKKAL